MRRETRDNVKGAGQLGHTARPMVNSVSRSLHQSCLVFLHHLLSLHPLLDMSLQNTSQSSKRGRVLSDLHVGDDYTVPEGSTLVRCTLGARASICNCCMIMDDTIIGPNGSFSNNCTIGQGVIICDGATFLSGLAFTKESLGQVGRARIGVQGYTLDDGVIIPESVQEDSITLPSLEKEGMIKFRDHGDLEESLTNVSGSPGDGSSSMDQAEGGGPSRQSVSDRKQTGGNNGSTKSRAHWSNWSVSRFLDRSRERSRAI